MRSQALGLSVCLDGQGTVVETTREERGPECARRRTGSEGRQSRAASRVRQPRAGRGRCRGQIHPEAIAANGKRSSARPCQLAVGIQVEGDEKCDCEGSLFDRLPHPTNATNQRCRVRRMPQARPQAAPSSGVSVSGSRARREQASPPASMCQVQSSPRACPWSRIRPRGLALRTGHRQSS